jgi:hypothetical protein
VYRMAIRVATSVRV